MNINPGSAQPGYAFANIVGPDQLASSNDPVQLSSSISLLSACSNLSFWAVHRMPQKTDQILSMQRQI